MKLEHQKALADAIKTENGVGKAIEHIFDDYSQQIALAINPIDTLSAPFILSVLNSYSAAVSNQFPDAAKTVRELQQAVGSACITYPVKGGGPQ